MAYGTERRLDADGGHHARGLPAVRHAARHYLYAGIAVFCALGVYATSAAVTDLILVLAIGFVGFLMRRFDIPVAPLMIGVILGPLAETSLRNALLSSGGKVSILWGSSITWVLYGLMPAVLVFTAWRRLRQKKERDI